MNTPSPLIPQGATPPRPKNSLYIKILMVLSIHVVVIGGMLLQGCTHTTDTAKQDGSSPTPCESAPTVPANPPSTSSAPAAFDKAPVNDPNLAPPAPMATGPTPF